MIRRLALIAFALLAAGCNDRPKFRSVTNYPCASGKAFIVTGRAICKSYATAHDLVVEKRPGETCRVCSKSR